MAAQKEHTKSNRMICLSLLRHTAQGQAAAAITLMKVEEAEGARKRRDKDAVVLPATEKQKAFLRVLLEE